MPGGGEHGVGGHGIDRPIDDVGLHRERGGASLSGDPEGRVAHRAVGVGGHEDPARWTRASSRRHRGGSRSHPSARGASPPSGDASQRLGSVEDPLHVVHGSRVLALVRRPNGSRLVQMVVGPPKRPTSCTSAAVGEARFGRGLASLRRLLEPDPPSPAMAREERAPKVAEVADRAECRIELVVGQRRASAGSMASTSSTVSRSSRRTATRLGRPSPTIRDRSGAAAGLDDVDGGGAHPSGGTPRSLGDVEMRVERHLGPTVARIALAVPRA